MGSAPGFHVVVAGGGVAGLEAALALRDLAPEQVRTTMIGSGGELVYRPMAVGEPFGLGVARRYPLQRIAQDVGFELRLARFSRVDSKRRIAFTAEGSKIHYDALLLALGARAHPRFRHAITVDDRRLDEVLHGLVQDIEGDYVRSVAFVVPGRIAWPLPIYELSLMTKARAEEMNVDLAVTLVTPEDAPLAIFGSGASTAVAALLDEANIDTITQAYAEIPDSGRIVLRPGDRHLRVDRVVALPELFGPSVGGLSLAENGFIPVDMHCKARDVDRVYAAGDATDFPIKHGGIAAQQAVVAAKAIAALAGAPVEPESFDPEIHGILLTGGEPKYLSARIRGGYGFSSEISDLPTFSPPAKIAARYLGPYLERCPPLRRDAASDADAQSHAAG